jgi:hypothetical protein
VPFGPRSGGGAGKPGLRAEVSAEGGKTWETAPSSTTEVASLMMPAAQMHASYGQIHGAAPTVGALGLRGAAGMMQTQPRSRPGLDPRTFSEDQAEEKRHGVRIENLRNGHQGDKAGQQMRGAAPPNNTFLLFLSHQGHAARTRSTPAGWQRCPLRRRWRPALNSPGTEGRGWQ